MFNELRQPYLEEFEAGGGSDGFDDVETFEEPAEETMESQEQPEEPVEDTKPTEEVTEPYKLKVKFNHQEMEIPETEAATWIQKGMNYEKAVERAKQEARDDYIAEQGYTWNGKAITTEAEYRQALMEKEIYDRYQEKGLPEDVIQELVESKKFREESKAEKQAAEQQKAEIEKQRAIQQDAVDFFNWFKAENGREFEVGKDEMPPEAWQAHLEGRNLISEYSKYENKILKQKLKTVTQNTENLKKAPVNGVTKHGSDNVAPKDAFLEGFDED